MGLVQQQRNLILPLFKAVSITWILLVLDACNAYINLADIECGQQKIKYSDIVRSPRIAKGRKALHGEYPWIVSLQYSSTSGGHFCGGFLISRSTIISAAHCFTAISKDRVTVVVGEHVIGRAERPINAQAHAVARILVHPEYTTSNKTRNDIVLIHLRKPVEWNPYVQPACIATAEEDDLKIIGETSQLAGWGQVTESSGTSDTLMTVEMNLISRERCTAEYSDSAGVWGPSETQVCAVAAEREDGGGCKGDSGSPLMIRETSSSQNVLTVLGVHVGGDPHCGRNNMLPGVFIHLPSYMSWIQRNVL